MGSRAAGGGMGTRRARRGDVVRGRHRTVFRGSGISLDCSQE